MARVLYRMTILLCANVAKVTSHKGGSSLSAPSARCDLKMEKVLTENKATQNRPKQHRARRNSKEGKEV